MYGPGSYPPHYGYPPQPHVIYVQQQPQPNSGGRGNGRGRGRGPRNDQPVDVLTYLVNTKETLEKVEKAFKKEEKKDDKSKGRTFTLLETVGLNFIFMLPTTLILYVLLKAFAKVGGL